MVEDGVSKLKKVVSSVENALTEEGLKKTVAAAGEKFRDFTETEKLEGFSFRELFIDAFKKHSVEDIERYCSVGTPDTIPDIRTIDASWPRPWMFLRSLGASAVMYVLLAIAWELFENPILLPGVIMVGAMAIPLAVNRFFFEMNARRNVSLYQVQHFVFLGGIISLFFSLILFELSLDRLGWLGASIAGLVEEPGKLMALLVVARMPKYHYKLNGLLFGACVGTGFAVFESMGYAFNVLMESDVDGMNINLLLRGALSPFAHIVWTAIAGAAMWRVKGTAPFRMSMVTNKRFWHLFLIPVVLHMIWNADFQLPFLGKYILLGVIAWVVVFALIQEGLRELQQEKKAALEAST